MPTPRKYIWRVTWAEWATEKLTRHLRDGWEPFGATAQNVWLRKRKSVEA